MSSASPMGGSLRRLDLRVCPLSLAANAPEQIPQGSRREQRDGRFIIGTPLVVCLKHGQIGPPPGQGPHHPVGESDQHPWRVITPEDPADATSLPAGPTLFRSDREGRTAKCNIRCSLSLG